MRTAGIICECNPIHDGHRYLMKQARKAGADAVVCVMSGCFTQRGEAAILDPRSRAELLLSGGADAVLELPFPYSCASAEFFASAGVSILGRLCVDELWFGSECGVLEPLKRAAEISNRASFSAHYRARCAGTSNGTAEAYFDCLRKLGGDADPLSPNDILGVAYLRAAAEQGSGMAVHTVRRKGIGFREDTVTEGAFPSASALRKLLIERGIDAWVPYFSQSELQLVREKIREGLAPAGLEQAERAVLSAFRLMPVERLDGIPELAGGLGRRMAESAKKAGNLQAFLSGAVTKKYTEARVRRGTLYALADVRWEDLRREPAYAVLLAANATGCAFLKQTKKLRTVPVVTSHAEIPKTEAAQRQEELTGLAFALYTLCLPVPMPADMFLRCSSRIIML